MSFESDEHTRVLDDPMAMRALAHPLRIQLYELLGREGSMTGAAAGRVLGISQALASHHLRQLAKYGFLERVDGGNDRDRPWRRVHATLSWSHRPGDDEAGSAADVLERLWVDRAAHNLEAWQRTRDENPPEWEGVGGISQNLVYVTAEEAAALLAGIRELIAPFVERRRLGDPGPRPEGTMPFDITTVAVLRAPTRSGG